MRNQDGQFKKGQSGNPKGRPRRAISDEIEAAIKGDRTGAIQRLEQLADNGDVAAAKWLADRLYPTYKQTAAPVSIPALANANTTLTEKAAAILQAIGAGTLAPDQGRDLLAALSNVAKIIELDDLLARVEALEQPHDTH